MLSWVERRLAATLFATPPTATVEEALEHFLRVDALTQSRPWKDNCLFIAKVSALVRLHLSCCCNVICLLQCFIQKREYSEVAKWLKTTLELPSPDRDVSCCNVYTLSVICGLSLMLVMCHSEQSGAR